jgi:hypothetical protein
LYEHDLLVKTASQASICWHVAFDKLNCGELVMPTLGTEASWQMTSHR